MYETIRRPSVPADDPRLFKIKTGIVKAIKEAGSDGKERYYLEGIASSTVVDRHGDTITEQAQSQMLAAARGITMWLNHSYNVPEDILGVCEASALQAAVDAGGQDCLDLVIRMEVYANNPRAMQSWNAVNGGVKLGFSIGGAITDFEWVDEDDWWSALLINGLDLYEISLVGIPANPRAYTKFVEDIAGKMRSAAVERAKDIVRKAASKDAARALLKKSLIGETGESMQPQTKQCAFADGCEKKAMDATDLCEQHAAQAFADVQVEPHEPAEGEAQCSFKDGCEEKNAAGSLLCVKHMEAAKVTKCAHDGCEDIPADGAEKCVAHKDAADGDPIWPNEDACANMVRCLKHLNASMAHGMCTESLKNAESAHALLKSLLPQDYPYEDDPTDEPADPDDVQNGVGDFVLKVGVDATEAQQKIAELGEALTAKTAELEQLTSTATQRAAEVTDAEKRIDALKAEETALQAKIDALKATPTGRQTAQAGGSHSGAAYTVRSHTADQARKNLGAALCGVPVDDPALRPA